MRILSAYVAKEFMKQFLLLLAVFVSLYLIVDLGRIDGFLKHNALTEDVIGYYIYKIPLIISQTVAAAVLLSTTITLSTLTKYNEITAMKAVGISVYRLSLPILVIALAVSALTLFGNEYILPYTDKKVDYIKRVKIQKERPRSIFKNGRIWFRGEEGLVYNIQAVGPRQTLLQGVTLYYFNSDFELVKRLDAAQASWVDGRWLFEQGNIYHFRVKGVPRYEKFDKKVIALKETPQDFKQVERNPKTMGYRELSAYVEDLKSKGYEVSSYLVDLHSKLALPFISLVMAIIGTPFALSLNRSGARSKGFALTLAIGFAYWVVLALGMAVGRGGALPPVLAAWGANLLFASLGFYLLGSLNH